MEHHKISRHIVSRETFLSVDELIEKHRPLLEEYLDQLQWWNQRVNLVSRNVSRETLQEHIRHSLLLTRFKAYQQADLIVDAGTGGGLPGVPLAVVSPEKKFILNDIVSKKVMALREMVRKLDLGHVVCADRSIEKLDVESSFLLVSKHAFKIDELWQMVKNKSLSAMVFYKGHDFEEKLEGIEEQLIIESHNLSKGPEFYREKALVFVTRR